MSQPFWVRGTCPEKVPYVRIEGAQGVRGLPFLMIFIKEKKFWPAETLRDPAACQKSRILAGRGLSKMSATMAFWAHDVEFVLVFAAFMKSERMGRGRRPLRLRKLARE